MRLYHLIFLLALLAPLNSADAFFERFFRTSQDLPPPEQTERARPIFERAQELHEAGNERAAMRQYRRIWRRLPASAYSARATFNYAQIRYERKDWVKSYEAFQRVLAFYPDFPEFNRIVHTQFDIALRVAEGENTRFLFVFPYRALNRAAGYFAGVVNNAPYHDLAPLALMNMALIYQYQGQTMEAIDSLDWMINEYPNSLLASDAYLALAETFADLVDGPEYDQGATREAMSYFEDFLILFSEHEEVARAEVGLREMEDVFARSKLVIGQFYFRYRSWYDAAEIFFNETITTAPDSEAAEAARDYLVRIEERREQIEQARSEGDREAERNFLQRLLRRG